MERILGYGICPDCGKINKGFCGNCKLKAILLQVCTSCGDTNSLPIGCPNCRHGRRLKISLPCQ